MRFIRSPRCWFWLAASCTWPALSSAQTEAAAAQALFDEGRALMDAQRYADACPKLAESQRLDPGIGTQFHLANCYELQGRVASAWATFLEVASIARASNQGDRERAALARAARLESRLPRLKLVVPAESQLPELEIRRDGAIVAPAQWGSALPIDPGPHEISALAPGKGRFSQEISTTEGTTVTVEIQLLTSDGSTSGARKESDAPAPDTVLINPHETVPVAPPAEATVSSGPGPLVLVLGAVGIAGLGLGGALGLMAKGKNDDSKEHCNATDENRCTAEGVKLRDEARSLGNGATIAFVAGGAALATAGVLWISGAGKPSEHTSARRFVRTGFRPRPSGAELVLGGNF